VPLLELVHERRFNAGSKRHRAKLLTDDSLLDFVQESEVVTLLYASLAQIQERYRQVYGTLDRSYSNGAARSFQLSLERLDADGDLERSRPPSKAAIQAAAPPGHSLDSPRRGQAGRHGRRGRPPRHAAWGAVGSPQPRHWFTDRKGGGEMKLDLQTVALVAIAVALWVAVFQGFNAF